MTAPLTLPDAPREAPVSDDTGEAVRALLVRFTVALNRRRAYAATHPMVEQAETALYTSCAALLRRRPRLSIGVAHRELLVDGEPLTNGGASARELAERLHRRGVGGLAFTSELTPESVRTALAWLATDPYAPGGGAETGERRDPSVPEVPVSAGNGAAANGAASSGTSANGAETAAPTAATPPHTPGLHIAQMAYDRLSLSTQAHEQVGQLWRTLATLALESPGAAGGGAEVGAEPASAWVPADLELGANHGEAGPFDGPSGGESGSDDWAPTASSVAAVADGIMARANEPAYLQRVGVVLQSLASQLRSVTPEARQEVAQRLREVLQRLDGSPLAAIIRAAGGAAAQRQYITSLIDVLPASVIVDWLEQTARATDQQLSHHLLRILSKLATHATERRVRSDADAQLRAAARALVADWSLDDPNPIAHGALLDHVATTTVERPTSISAAASAPSEIDEAERPAPDADALRLVQMACEIDLAGADAQLAAQELVASGHAALLFATLAAAPGRRAAGDLHGAALEPDTLRRTLLRDPFDAGAARALLERVDPVAAPTLLDALELAAHRSARRLLLNTLRDFGPPIAPLLRSRLDGNPPWYFVRNLLLLLRDVTVQDAAHGADHALLAFVTHAQEQVRLEALRLLVENPVTRDPAVRRALDDPEPRVLAVALEAIAAPPLGDATRPARCPRDIALRLMRLVDAGVHADDLLVRAVRALAHADVPSLRDWLVSHVTRRTRLLRRTALAEGPTVVAALELLARRFGREAHAASVLALARQLPARDPRHIAVAAGQREVTP